MTADRLESCGDGADSVRSALGSGSHDASFRDRITLPGLILFIAAYILAGGFGQGLSLVPGVVITFWPPAGVFVGTLVMNTRRTWAWWIAAGCVAELACNALWFHSRLHFALLYFAANTVTAVTAALLVERFGRRSLRLESLKDVAVLTCLAAGIAPIASATIIAITDAAIGKHTFGTAWLLVWIGDGTGLLIATPLTMVAIDTWRQRKSVSWRVIAEAFTMYLFMMGVGFLAMRDYLPTVYLLMPIVLWIATRFLVPGVAVALPVLALMTITFTAMGRGEFSGGPELMQSKVLSLQVFFGVSAASALLVAAISAERQQAIEKLNAVKAELEQNVEKRTTELQQSNQELRGRNLQLDCLSQVSQALIAADSTENELLSLVFAKVAQSIGAEVYVSYQPFDATSMRICNWAGLTDSELAAFETMRYGEMLCGRVAVGRQAIILEDMAHAELEGCEAARAAGYCAYAGFPLLAGDLLLGTIAFLTRMKTHFADGEPAMIQAVCDQVAATLHRMRLTTELLKSEERLRLAVKATGVGIFDFDPSSHRQSFSTEALQLWGFDSGAEPTTELVLSTVHPEDRARAEAVTAASLDPMGNGRFAIEHRLIHPNGSVRWISAMGQTQFIESNGQRRAVRSVGTMLDITERKRTEIELRSSQQRLELGTSVGELALIEIDFITGETHLSQEAARLFGLGDNTQVVPRSVLHDTIHPDDRPVIMRRIAASLDPAGDGGFSLVHRVIRPSDGSIAWLRVRYRVFFEGDGDTRRAVRAMLAAIDVTAERNAQEMVRESEARMQQALRTSRSYTFEWQPGSDRVRRSASCADILQLEGEEAVSDTSRNYFKRVVAEDRAAYAGLISKLSPSAPSYEIEYRITLDDGRVLNLEETGQGSFDASGRLIWLFGVATDITARKRAEESLRASGELLVSMFEGIAGAVTVSEVIDHGENFRFLTANPGCEEWTGLPAAQWIGRTPAELLQAESAEAIRRRYRQAVVEERAVQYEERLVFPSGVSWALTTATPLRDAAGKIVRVVATSVDITARKQAEEALRRAHQRLETALEASQVILFHQDRELRYTWIKNPAHGYATHEIIGKRDRDIIQPVEDAAQLEAVKQEVIVTGAARRHEVCMVNAGERRFYDLFIQPDCDASGTICGVNCAAVDVTERKNIEAALRESQSRQVFLLNLSDALRTLSDAAAIQTEATRALGEYLQVDRAYYIEICQAEGRVLVQREYRRGEIPSLVGEHPIAEFDWVIPSMRRGETIVVADVECSSLVPNEEQTVMATSGIAAHVNAPLIKSGELVGALCVAQSSPRQWTAADIALVTETTERIWSAVERSKAEAALKESDRRKDEFLATLSHELRNPLATIRSGLEVIRLTPDNSVVIAETRDLMQRQVTHLVALVDDLLEVSRISRGKLKLRREIVDIADAIHSAIEACRPLLQEAGHDLQVDLPSLAVYVAGDPHRITQMISNLLNNAAKYTPPQGKITIATTLNETHIGISVQDTGVGISKKQMPRIFDLFAQVKNESSAYAGLGIGLSLVKSLAEMHGGSITAVSPGKNKGSTFTVHLPICHAGKPAGENTGAAPLNGKSASRRVLVVDDNLGAARTLSIIVKMLGNEVWTACNGLEAVEKGREFHPEVIIMDIGMPIMDGYAAARAIRDEPWGKSTLLIALTGWGQDDDRQRTMEAGFDHHLVKPVEPQLIRQLLTDLSTTAITASSP